MQIYSYQPQTVTPASNNATQSNPNNSAPKNTPPPVNNNDQVTLSSTAKNLSAAEQLPVQTLPVTPENPNSGEKLEQYVDIKKTRMQYEVASDVVNMATGNSDGISAPTAAYLSNNEEAREVVLQNKAMQQQYQNMQTYAEQTEQAENNWVV